MTPLPHPSKPRLSQVSARFGYLRRFGLLGVLALLFVALLIGQHLVAGGDPSLEFNAPAALPPASGLVDQSPLRLARQLAPLAAVPQERQYAQDALRLADSEVDQAFASALRGATQHAPPLTGQALKISQRLSALNDRIKAEQANVTARQHGPGTADDDPQLQLAQAQLALDTDEADELHQTLIRLGGDRHALIQQALDEHEAVHKQETGAAVSQTEALEAPEALTSLIGKLHALSSLRSRHRQLVAARNAAQAMAAQLLQQRNALSNDTEDANAAAAGNGAPGVDTATTTAHLRALAANREAITQYEHRIHDLESLAGTYDKWDALVRAQERTVLRRVVRVFAFIVAILVATILVGRLLQRLLTRRTLLDRRRQQTLHFVLSFAIQLVGALLILIVIFGTPRQTEPIVELRPIGGLEVVIRYITRAQDRFEMRSRLNQRLLAILHAPQPGAPGDPPPEDTLAESAASER